MNRFSQDTVRGWNAAQASQPFDRTETADWCAGFALFISTTASRDWAKREGLSNLVH